MAKAPAFQWYPKDCDTDENVKAMDDREFGFYMRCLNHAWLNNGLPSDLDELARVMGRPRKYFDKIWSRVGKCFTVSGSRLINTTQEKQRSGVAEFADSKRAAAQARWSKHKQKSCKTDAGADAHASSVQCSASPSPSASPNHVERAPTLTEFPETTAAIREYFPAVDDGLIMETIHNAMREYADATAGKTAPPLADVILSEAVHAAKFPKQFSPGPFKTGVARCVRTWAEQAIRQGSIR